MKFAAEVSYEGNKFFGWQIQPDRPTVQEAMEKALSLLDGSPVNAAGAGRTDAGVHAKAQVCSFEMSSPWDRRKLLLALNANLPEGVSVMRIAEVGDDFHARFSAETREYRYFIWNESAIYPALKDKVYWVKAKKYNWENGARAAQKLLGEHDFRNFCHFEGTEHSTVRTIKFIRLYRRLPFVMLRIKADGFLHNMVRIIMGNLMLAAKGVVVPEEMERLLDVNLSCRSDGGMTCPACGLYLWHIDYKENLWT